ncbi:Acetylxylan esterase 2 [Colletotrichum spinosum]|uniref:Acetylxylan esterase 2 n=1 Tax=Colletotrichum spinosum TaxID=1347390 RepID=A0A4V3HSY1_9PEZI|nr:Acetylxylan esterase 2 [Colletotrichum spinosum]
MRVKTTAAVAAGLLAGASAQNSTATCADGVYLIVARGTTEPAGTGRIGSVADGVVAAVPGSQIAPVDYPAVFVPYDGSVENGTNAMKLQLTQYNSRCPNSKVALVGFSQGAQIVGDTLCGSIAENAAEGLDLDFDPTAPVPASIIDQSVIAAVLFGDPTHAANSSWDRGTSRRAGLFPRTNFTACQAYTPKIASWCDLGDRYCDASGNQTNNVTHGSYFGNYTEDAVDFIVAQFNASKANGTSPTTPPPTTAPDSAAAASAPGFMVSLVGLSILTACFL